MTTYPTNEASVQDGALRELYVFTLASGVYNLTSHDEDVVYNSVTYSKCAGLSRGPIQRSPITDVRELVISIPRDHAIAAAVMPSPPWVATVTITRIYADSTSSSADRRMNWAGSIEAVSVDKEYARLRVPSALDLLLDVTLPIAVLGRNCRHQLYDVGCTVPRTGANVKTPTAVSQVGTALTVSSLAGWTTEAQLGEVVRDTDGERRSIIGQAGAVLTLDVPFGTMVGGDALHVYRGCDKLKTTCDTGFANTVNFSGSGPNQTVGGVTSPLLNNPASPTGKGLG